MKTKVLKPTFLALLTLSFILTGCDDEEKDKALAEAEQEATIDELLKTIELLEGSTDDPLNEDQGHVDVYDNHLN